MHTEVTTLPCPSGDPLIDCPSEATGCSSGLCACVVCPELFVNVTETCAEDGANIIANVIKGASTEVVDGQFTLLYAPSCMRFNSITPGAEYSFEVARVVDDAAGTVFYRSRVDPLGSPGAGQETTLASFSFSKIGGCNSCNVCLAGASPFQTFAAFADGGGCAPLTQCSDLVASADAISLSVPGNVTANADCDFSSAIVEWGPPTCNSACATCSLACTGTHHGPDGVLGTPDDFDLSFLAMTGGEHSIGTTTYACAATGLGPCGGVAQDSWTVTVEDIHTLDVTVQLSPILAGDVTRCIVFELFEDCAQAPRVLERELHFRGEYDHLGRLIEELEVPLERFSCITARDKHHSIRSCDYPTCVGGVYQATFRGDPFFGGNWLVQGNLDGWDTDNPLANHNVIDIQDLITFIMNDNTSMSLNVSCDQQAPHADINGDGIVDALDYSFISMNFYAISKDCCCGQGTLDTVRPITSVTVSDLRKSGRAELGRADLNHDGVVDTADVAAFLAGARPTPRHRIRVSEH